MKQRFLRQTTDDNLILQGMIHEPDKPTKNLILHIHGMSGNFYENRFLDAMAKTFTDNGHAFLAPNTRGHDYIADIPLAGREEKFVRIGNTFEKFEDCVLDIKCWMDFAEKERYSKIILQGHSLGCAKSIYYYYKTKDKRVSKIVLASHSDTVGFGEQFRNGELIQLAKKFVSEGRGKEILPIIFEDWSFISAETALDFWTRGNPIDVFNTHSPNEKSEALESVDIPVFAFMGTKKDSWIDKVGGPKKSIEIVKSKTKNAPKFDTAVVEGAPHSYFGHEREVAELIINWIKNT